LRAKGLTQWETVLWFHISPFPKREMRRDRFFL
jgi:hypothetical protein